MQSSADAACVLSACGGMHSALSVSTAFEAVMSAVVSGYSTCTVEINCKGGGRHGQPGLMAGAFPAFVLVFV